MMRALYSGVSGLRNHQTRMDVVGTNISNVNTTGFKAGRANFQDMLSQTLKGAGSAQGNLGGTNPMQVGLGMSVASIDTLFTDGSIQSTGVASDVAIAGDGFFVVADGDKQYYTRAGNFYFDSAGNYETASGMKVMGWMADSDGNISASGSVVPIVKLAGQTMAARATTKAIITGNLNSSAANGSGATTSVDLYDSLGAAHKLTQTYYKVNQFTAGSTGNNVWYCKSQVSNATAVSNTYTRMVFSNDGTLKSAGKIAVAGTNNIQAATISNLQLGMNDTTQKLAFSEIDSLGEMHAFVMEFTYTKGASGAVGSWNCAVKDSADTTKTLQTYTVNFTSATATVPGPNMYTFTPTPTAGSTGSLISYTNSMGGTETINLNIGSFKTPTTDCKGSGYFSDPTNGTVLQTESPITFNCPGANSMTVSIDRTQITQASDTGSSLTVEQNGYAMGTLAGYNFDSSGIMTGTFSNGQKKKIAQLALANFTNPGGLNKVSDTLYEKSNNSGEPSIGATNTGGRGKITPSSLEMSNVDLAQQFSDMIVTQRGYQANSKIITTSDSMLEELVNLKR